MTGNPELRAELSRIVSPPEGVGLTWLDVQIQQLEELDRRLPHSVRLHTRCSSEINELNCFMFALGLDVDSIRDMCDGPVFPGKAFVRFILTNNLLAQCCASDQVVDGDIVFYIQGDSPQHAGIFHRGEVISKWGSGATHIWQHAIWDVPSEYGNEVKVFAPLASPAGVYREWAAGHGL